MKIINYIFVFIISLSGLNVSAQEADTLNLIPKETKSLDPVRFDTETYNKFKQDKAYDYHNEAAKSPSLSSIITEAIFKWLLKNINPNITTQQVKTTLWIITAIVIIIILLLLYFYRPSLFYFNREKKSNFQIEDEDIHSVDFEKMIEKAIKSQQYSDAIRWCYLQLLKELHQRELISWDPNKTVNEYTYEIKRSDLKPDFRKLSLQFLYYRYGNFDASHDAFNHFSGLSNEIIKRI